MGRLLGLVFSLPMMLWQAVVEDSLAELRRYRTQFLEYVRARRLRGGPGGPGLGSVFSYPILLIQYTVIALLSVPVLILQSFRFVIVNGVLVLIFAVVSAPAALRYWLSFRKKWELAILVVLSVGVLGVGGWFGHRKFILKPPAEPWMAYNQAVGNAFPRQKILADLREHLEKHPDDAAAKERLAAWEKRDSLGQRYDAIQGLETVLRFNPNDPDASPLLAAWQSGEAPENDPKTQQLLMFFHYREMVLLAASSDPQDREAARAALAAAAREAEKYSRSYPRDWLARCIQAQHLLSQEKPDALSAARQMSQLPVPQELGQGPTSAMTGMVAIELYARLREPARQAAVMDYMAGVHLRRVAEVPPLQLPPSEGLQLLQIYQLSASSLRERSNLAVSWPAVQKLCRNFTNPDVVKTVAPEQLGRVGILQESFLLVANAFYQTKVRGFETEQELRAAIRQVEEHLEQLWAALREKSPTNGIAYLGQASQAFRAGNVSKALQYVDEGLKVCTDKTDVANLTTAKARFLRLAKRPKDEIRFLDEALSTTPDDERLLLLRAQAAMASLSTPGQRADQRLPEVLELCRRALAKDPKLYWARVMEGQVCLRLTRPREAAEAMAHLLPERKLDVTVAQMYVQGLAGDGRVAEADKYLRELLETPDQNSRDLRNAIILSLLAGVRGLEQTNHRVEATDWAERVIARDPENLTARLMLADVIRARIEEGPRDWDKELVAKAVTQYQFLIKRTAAKPNLVAVNNMVWLMGKGLGDYKGAWEAAEPLLKYVAEQKNPPAEIIDTIAALMIGRGDFAAARPLLDRAVLAPVARVSYFYHLALVLRQEGRYREAEEQLLKAKSLKLLMTSRESHEVDTLLAEVRQKLESAPKP